MGCLSLSRSTFRDQDVNAFHMTGWPYFITLCELGAGALLNARLLYLLDAFVRRKWYDGTPDSERSIGGSCTVGSHRVTL